MDGQLHIRVDLQRCQEIEKLKSRAPLIVERIILAARDSGITINDYQFRPFDPEQGYTLTVVIEESMFIIQTWPEWGFVNIDIMVCNYTRDNTEVTRRLAARLRDFFGGEAAFLDETPRGPWDEPSDR